MLSPAACVWVTIGYEWLSTDCSPANVTSSPPLAPPREKPKTGPDPAKPPRGKSN